MKSLNKKGFTLIELLVAISILGIILIIALPQLSNLQSQNQTTKFKKYAETMLTSAKLYTDSYAEDMFGNNKSGCFDVKYEYMKEKDLLKDIKINGSTCADENTFIRVRKTNAHYIYQASIICKDKNNEPIYEDKILSGDCDGNEDDDSPTIEIQQDQRKWKYGWTKGTGEKVTVKIWDEYGMLENAKVKFTWTKNGNPYGTEKIYSYKNKRYDGTEDKKLSYLLELPQGETGIFKLTVTPINVRDSVGNYQTEGKSVEYQLDNTAPSVPKVILKKWKDNSTKPESIDSAKDLDIYDAGDWSSKKIFTYPLDSKDNSDGSEGVGHIVYQHTATGKTSARTDQKSIYRNVAAEGLSYIKWRACDGLGNCSENTKDYTIKIDRTAPTCTSSGDSTTWTNESRTIKYGCKDSDSKCNTSYDGGSETFSSTKKKATINSYIIKDNAGNETTCEERTANVYVDTTDPTCSVSGGSSDWTKNDVTVTGTCSDTGGSGCKKESVSKTFKENTNSSKSPGTVYDNAGNSKKCGNKTVKIDKTKPTCGSATGEGTSYTSGSRTISVACSDTGGSGCKKSEFSKTWDSGTVETDSITIKDNAGNTRSCTVDVLRRDLSLSFSGNMGKWVAAKERSDMDKSYCALDDSGDCIKTKNKKAANVVLKATATESGFKATFKWTQVNGKATYVCAGYVVRIYIVDENNNEKYSVIVKDSHNPTCWDKGKTHTGSFSYTFPKVKGTYYLKMDGDSSDPNYDVTLGTIKVS